MTTVRARALGGWREELEKLKADLNFEGMKDLIVEIVRARPDDRIALKEFVSGLMGLEWGAEVERLIASAAEEALDKEGKAFILRPTQPRVDRSRLMRPGELYRIRREGPEKSGDALAKLGLPEQKPMVPMVRWDNGVPAVLGEANVEPNVRAMIEWMNKRHAVIGNIGGKCKVVDWIPSFVNDDVLVPSFQGFDDFKRRYSDWVPTNEGRKKQGELWLDSARRAKYDMITFQPGASGIVVREAEGVPTTMLNTWRGFGVVPKAGKWPRLERHIIEVLANGNEAFAKYIFDWTAHGYQRPGMKRGVTLVFQGPEGVGKGVFGHVLRRSYGSHGLYIAQPSQLVGKFNKHLWTICFIFADEAFFAGDKAHEDILKSLITESAMMVEPKGVDAFLVTNYIDLVMASNHKWVVPVGEVGRRFAVTEVSSKYGKGHCPDPERRAYFDPLFEELNGGGIAAMMWDLLQRPLDGWDPEAFPVTKALMKQKQLTLRGYDKAMESWLQTGDLPRDEKWDGRPDCATSSAMMSVVRKLRGCEYEPEGGTKDYLKEHFADVTDLTWRVPGQGNSGAKFFSLEECRQVFSGRFGGNWPWDESVKGWRGK